ncbi:MAG: hypothetical protein LBO08_02020 [Rickettsiales bacterium]|nr:hypothetical protein [Rickettsiales bacterium]
MKKLSILIIALLAADAFAESSADFAARWNGGAPNIYLVGNDLGNGNYGLQISDYLAARAAAVILCGSSDGATCGAPNGTAIYLNNYSLNFQPGWGSDLSATIQDLSIYNAAGGAIVFSGNGTGVHNLDLNGIYFYNNAGGAVAVSAQIQSAADNNYILTNNDFTGNRAASGGAVYMASNNSLQYGAANPTVFSVSEDTGTQSHYIALNKATSGNGGGIYFIYNNSQGDGVNDFSATGYTYWQNYAAGSGGAIYFGVINGNNPTINNLTVSGGKFVQNQAGSGGAIATEINGGGTNINVSIGGDFYSNSATGNGGAIYRVIGNQYSPYGGVINYDINGNFDGNKAASGGAIYSSINPGQATLNQTISGDFTNNYATGSGGAIYNYGSSANGLNIADGTLFWGNGAAYGGAIYNDGYGVINLNTGAAGISFGNNYSSSAANGSDIYQATSNAIINILGSGKVNINDGIGGLGIINQGAGTELNLAANSNSSGYAGVFQQSSGAVLNANGVMFGGLNNVGGTANINSHAGNIYFNAQMLDGGVMNYTSSAATRVDISAAAMPDGAGISFEGANAQANFNGYAFNLMNDISNGQVNNINFNGGDITLGANLFNGTTKYYFGAGAVINLADSSSDYQQYSFVNLSADSAAALSLKLGNDTGSLSTDSLSVASGGGIIGLGKVYIDDENGLITGLVRAIYGNVLKFQNGLTQQVATSLGTYNITTVNDQYLQFSAITTGGGGTSVSQNPDTGMITVDPGDGNTTIITQDPDTGMITVDPGDGNTTVVNPGDGGTINIPGGQVVITPGDGGDGPTINVSTPDTGAATVLVLNDVNALNAAAIAATFSSASARAWQIGATQTYYNSANLDDMAAGTFSVHGANAGTRTSVLSGLNASNPDTHQSLFVIVNDGTDFTLSDLIVEDAQTADGGAVLNMNSAGSSAFLNNLLVQNNSAAGDGGAVSISAGSVQSGSVDFYHNSADGDGGAIWNAGDNFVLKGGSFRENNADSGGAIYTNAAQNNDMVLYAADADLIFDTNTATTSGGAVFNDGYLTMGASASGDIVFTNNSDGTGANDIRNDGTLTLASLGGRILIGGGFVGTGTINKNGLAELALGADAKNLGFTGVFNMANGSVSANGEFFGGTTNVSAGTLNWNAGAVKDDSAVLNMTGGVINIYGSLRLGNQDDIIGYNANINLHSSGNYEIAGGTLYLGATDQLVDPDGTFGWASMSDGWLSVSGQNMFVYSGAFIQTGGVAISENMATVYLNQNSPTFGLFGGDMVLSNSTINVMNYELNLAAGSGTIAQTSGTLAMGDGAVFSSIDGILQAHQFAGKFALISMSGQSETIAKFSVDLDAQSFVSDKWSFAGGIASAGELAVHGNGKDIADMTAMNGTVVLDQINLLNAPSALIVPFTVLESASYDSGMTFAAAADDVMTPSGLYRLASVGNGNYELRFLDNNPDSARGQAVSQAMLGSQLIMTESIFDHVYLDSNECFHCNYQAWQFEEHRNGVWAKGAGATEKMHLSDALPEMKNDSYSVIAGFDFDAIGLSGPWHFLPTVFMAYNAGSQEFGNAKMNQDGIQLGFMGSWGTYQFITSALAYGGAYQNKMMIAGAEDKTSNWFTGAAWKSAYNIHITAQDFIIQPSLMASYNYYGKQDWTSSYGDIQMASGYLAGINLTPELAAILGWDGWAVFASAKYSHNFGNKQTATIGEIQLPEIGIAGFMEYAIGGNFRASGSLSFDAKFTTRQSSELSTYGGQLGIAYKF